MTGNGCPQGDGSLLLNVPVLAHDNLTQYANYAQYLPDVLSAFRTQMGITFDSVEPLNEPTDPWVAPTWEPGGLMWRPRQPTSALGPRHGCGCRSSATAATAEPPRPPLPCPHRSHVTS